MEYEDKLLDLLTHPDPVLVEQGASLARALGTPTVEAILDGSPSVEQPRGRLTPRSPDQAAGLRLALRLLAQHSASPRARALVKGCTKLNLNHHDAALLTDLRSLSGLTELTQVVAWQPTKLLSLAGVEALQKLEQLSIPGARRLRSAQELAGLPRLRTVNLRGAAIESAAGLDGPALRHVDLCECRQLQSLDGLGAGVQVVSAEYCQALGDLAGLAVCAALSSLRLSDIVACTDLSPLAGLPIKHLVLKRFVLKDLRVLSQLPTLRKLDLSACDIQELGALRAWLQQAPARVSGEDKAKLWQRLAQGMETRELVI